MMKTLRELKELEEKIRLKEEFLKNVKFSLVFTNWIQILKAGAKIMESSHGCKQGEN